MVTSISNCHLSDLMRVLVLYNDALIFFLKTGIKMRLQDNKLTGFRRCVGMWFRMTIGISCPQLFCASETDHNPGSGTLVEIYSD